MALDRVRYAHTNLVARDWRRLATFYEAVFHCEPLPPERDLTGDALARGTGVPGACLRGVHLALPGYGSGGPTLEIFQYVPAMRATTAPMNEPGLRHIAFEVDDVEATVARVLEHGGARIGETVTVPVPGAGRVTFAYVRDPEGNGIEVQSWSDA